MRFRIPGQSIHVRVFEPVETVNQQYHVYDTGIDYGNGDIDSVAVGGAFATLEKLANRADEESLKKAAKKAKKKAKKRAKADAEAAASTDEQVDTNLEVTAA